jgi:hypothetical protein
MKRGRYSSRFIEASGGRLATRENFPPEEFPKPGQTIISHTPDSFISWLVMYFTDSVWSHMALGVDHGEIVEATLEGTVAHPFADILNGSDYLLVYTPPQISAEQERGFVESARSLVGGTRYGYLTAAIIGLRLLAGRDINYRLRLSADLMMVLEGLCWLGRRRRRIAFGAVLGLLYTAIVLLHTKYRRTRRASHLHNMTSDDPAVRALARFPGIRGRAIDGIISMRERRNSSVRGLSSISPVFEQVELDSGDDGAPDETTVAMESYLRKRLRSKGKRDLLRVVIENAWQRRAGRLPLRTVGKWTLLTSTTSPSDAAQTGSVLHGAEGIRALGKLELHVGTLQSEVAARHGPVAWFLMLRRASNCVRTGLPQASSEILRVAAAAAAQSSVKVESHWRLLLVPWMPTPKILSDLDELLSLSILKRNINVAMRRLAKGQAVRLVDAFAGAPVDDDVELEKAIELYDQRTHAVSGFFKAEWLGIAGRTIPVTRDSSGHEGSVPTWADLRRLGLVPEQLVDRLLQDFDPYIPWAINVEEHMRVLDPAAAAFRRETIAIEVLLSAAAETLSEKGMLHPDAGGTWSEYGYMVVRRRSFVSKLGRLLREKIGDQAEAAQLWMMFWAGSVHILYPVGKGWLLLDLEAASDWLPIALSQGTGGTLADQWPGFREQIQEIIDSSPWRPEGEFRHLIGQTLSIDSESSVAIDAVATRRDALILISVNNLQSGETFMSGEMEAVRSLRAEIEGASNDWDAAVGKVRMAPEMLGLETEASNVDGVIVMPFIPFVHLGSATRLVEGLRHVASIEELIMRVHSG